jgi:glutaredoxin-related protein
MVKDDYLTTENQVILTFGVREEMTKCGRMTQLVSILKEYEALVKYCYN